MKNFDVVKLIDAITNTCIAVGKVDRIIKGGNGEYKSLRFTPKFKKPVQHISFVFELGWRLLSRDPMHPQEECFNSNHLYEFIVVEQ